MGKTKNALIRYRIIDKCLRRVDEKWTWKELAEKCADALEELSGEKDSISERTIKKDLNNMRHNEDLGYFAPIAYDRKEKSYYYENRNFSITESPLSRQDGRELKSALNLLRQFTGFSYLKGINNVIEKLQLMVSESNLPEKQVVHLEQPLDIPGQKWLDSLYNAIRSKRSISINYHPFGQDSYHVIISPMILKEYDHRWYLLAYSHEKKSIRTYGLERISDLRESFAEYVIPNNFDADTYFKNVIGITVNESTRLEEIQLKVNGLQVNYFDTKPIHLSQKKVKTSDNYSVYCINVYPNYELTSKILSFGGNVEVISPDWFREELKKMVSEMFELYS